MAGTESVAEDESCSLRNVARRRWISTVPFGHPHEDGVDKEPQRDCRLSTFFYCDFQREAIIPRTIPQPTEQEAARLMQEAQNTPPDANTLYLQKAAEQAEAEAKKANADTIYKISQAEQTNAKTEETKANTLKILQDIDSAKLDKLLQLLSIIDTQQASLPQADTQQPPTALNGEQITGELWR